MMVVLNQTLSVSEIHYLITARTTLHNTPWLWSEDPTLATLPSLSHRHTCSKHTAPLCKETAAEWRGITATVFAFFVCLFFLPWLCEYECLFEWILSRFRVILSSSYKNIYRIKFIFSGSKKSKLEAVIKVLIKVWRKSSLLGMIQVPNQLYNNY